MLNVVGKRVKAAVADSRTVALEVLHIIQYERITLRPCIMCYSALAS